LIKNVNNEPVSVSLLNLVSAVMLEENVVFMRDIIDTAHGV